MIVGRLPNLKLKLGKIFYFKYVCIVPVVGVAPKQESNNVSAPENHLNIIWLFVLFANPIVLKPPILNGCFSQKVAIFTSDVSVGKMSE